MDSKFAQLTLVCDRCGREAVRSGFDEDVWQLFRDDGWVVDMTEKSSKPFRDVICTSCAYRRHEKVYIS